MKKIVILVMSCQDEFFINQEKVVDETWGADIIAGKYPNVTLYKYRGGYNSNDVTNDNVIKLRCEDDINNTFKKTWAAFNILTDVEDYDYVFRVNTSTYVNVDLLAHFVESLDNDEILWCGELYSLSEAYVPQPLYLFGRGNALLFSRKLINIIMTEGISFLYSRMTDDNTIGNILNSYWIKHHKNYLNHIRAFRHGWFKCTENGVTSNNKICTWYNEDCDFEFMKTFLTIQTKRYWKREIENEHYYELHNRCFVGNKDKDIDNTVKLQFEHSLNPQVFIGSILGYIDYSTWVRFDKQELYNIEVNHKSADDINRGKWKDLIIL